MADVATLSENIAEYEKMQRLLETDHWGEYAVFYDREFLGTFKEFPDAATFAAKRWGRGPYLIRKIGRQTIVLPASVSGEGNSTPAAVP